MTLAGQLNPVGESAGQVAAELDGATGIPAAHQPRQHELGIVSGPGEGQDVANAVLILATFAASRPLLHLAEALDLIDLEALAVQMPELLVLEVGASLASCTRSFVDRVLEQLTMRAVVEHTQLAVLAFFSGPAKILARPRAYPGTMVLGSAYRRCGRQATALPPMTRLSLPDFEDTDCWYLHICALGDPDNKDLARELKSINKAPMVAGYNSAAGRAYVRLARYLSKTPHFHVDIALGKYFGKKQPKSTHRKEQILSVVSRLSAFQWHIHPLAIFSSSREAGKRFYSALGSSIDYGDKAEISLTGIKLRISNADVRKLSIDIHGDSVIIEMTGIRSRTNIGEDFIRAGLGIFDAYHKAFTGEP